MNYSSTRQSSSDDAIRRFLLDDLQDGERTRVEQRLFEDEEFEARVRLEELAMADDYARKRLSAADNERFRTRFLVTEDRSRALAVSQALQTKLSAAAPVKTETFKLRNWFDFRQPVWRYAFAALLLLIVFATVWRKVKEPPQLVKELIPKVLRPKSKPLASQPVEANHPDTTSSPDHAAPEPTPPPHSSLLLINLDQNNSAAQPAVITAAAAANPLRFQIASGKQAEAFHVEVLTANGASVFSSEAVKSNNSELSFELPAGLLKSGEYQTRISVGKEPVTTYYLRVE